MTNSKKVQTKRVQAKKTQPPKTFGKKIAVAEIKSFPFFVTGLIFIVLSLCLSFAPGVERGWGLNYIKYFAPWVIVLYYLLLLCFWLPPTNKVLLNAISKISRQSVIAFLGKYRFFIFAAISIFFGYLFYLLEIKYIFLGDMDIRAKQIEQGEIITDEYFTMVFFKHAYIFLHEKLNFTGIQTVRFFDYITGTLFIFVSLCISNLLGNTFLKKLAVFCTAILSLTILLQFCGYAEIYAFPVLFLSLYLFTCILHLKGKASVFVPLIVLLFGLGVHLMLACMLPSLLFLFYRDKLWKHELFRKRNTFFILILIAIPFVYVAYRKFGIRIMLPLSPGENNLLTMFSIAHYKEFLNSQLLASGIGFLIWIATIIYTLVYRIKYDAVQWFFLIASVSIVGLMFVFNGVRGTGDWDIFSFAAVVYNLANASYFLMLHDKKLCKNIKYGLLMISGFSVLHTSMWIATNKTDASIEWVENAFATDPANYYKKSINNEAMIAAMFAANNLTDRALKWNKQAYLNNRSDPNMGFNYANELLKYDKKDEAYAILEKLTADFPFYPLPYPVLINAYITSQNYNALYNLLIRMKTAYEQYPEAFTSRLPKEQIESYFNILNELSQQIQR